LELEWEVRSRHKYREANLCADTLAHAGCDLGSDMIVYESCLAHLAYYVLADISGTNVPRITSL
jgi:hypothetical protein